MTEPIESLSQREIDVLECVSRGASNKEIASELTISPHTVKVHLRNIYGKLGATSRTDAVARAVQNGILTLESPTIAVEQPIDEPERSVTVAAVEPAVVPPAAISTPVADSPAVGRSNRHWPLLAGVAAVAILLMAGIFGWNRLRESTVPDTVAADFVEEPIADSYWTRTRPMPAARAEMATVSIGLNLYQIGGVTDEGVSAETLVYATDSHTWQLLAAKPQPIKAATAAVLTGQIFVIGGADVDNNLTANVAVYSPAQDAWRSVAALPAPHRNLMAVADTSAIYVFGGTSTTGISDNGYVFRADNNSWRPLPPLPTPRSAPTGGLIDGKIYVVGGFDAAGAELSICERFDIDSETWGACPEMLLARGGASAAVVLNKLYVIGGGASADVPFGELLDISSSEWQVINMPMLADQSEWSHLGVAAVEARIYAVGGQRGNTLLDETLIYAPLVYQYLIPSVENG